MNDQRRTAILGGMRTPFAKAFGRFSDVSAVELGSAAIQAALKALQLDPMEVDEVVMGNVASPPDAANIARVVAINAGIPVSRIAHTVNRNCGSGMEAIVSGGQAICDGRSQLVVVGGTESMSNIPFLFSRELKDLFQKGARAKTFFQKLAIYSKFRPRHFHPVVGIQLGLTDPTCGLNMGQTAEVLAKEFGITRRQQDAFAVESHRRAVVANENGFLAGEIAPWLEYESEFISGDVGPRPNQSMDQLAKLRPIFDSNGTVTAGNSCSLTDGAVALVIASNSFIDAKQLSPLGYVAGIAISGCDPRRMGLGPVYAIAKILRESGLSLPEIDLIEINEAFAAQVLACLAAISSQEFAQNELGMSSAVGAVDPSKLNVNGGAIAIGHPVGSTGARLVLTLLRSLRARGFRRGIASLCIGGGQGMAILLETI